MVHRKRDDERLVVASQQIIYHDLGRQPVRILEANAHITELQRAEAELNQSREQLRALADSLLRAREEEATRIARELHDQLVGKGAGNLCCSTSRLHGRSGLDVLKEIRASISKVPVLVLSGHPEEQYAVRVLKPRAVRQYTISCGQRRLG